MDIKQFFQDFVNLDFDELVDQCRPFAATAYKVCLRQEGNESDAIAKLIVIISSVVCVDGVVNRKEHEFFNALFYQDISYDRFDELFKDKNSENLREGTIILLNKLSYEEKKAFALLLTGFAACNETISFEEQKYLTKLILG